MTGGRSRDADNAAPIILVLDRSDRLAVEAALRDASDRRVLIITPHPQEVAMRVLAVASDFGESVKSYQDGDDIVVVVYRRTMVFRRPDAVSSGGMPFVGFEESIEPERAA
jgi:NAD(P)H-hydrate repair Nnr-like enzyme with NAD(P)H-hydrate dehydratase domain